MTSDEKSFATQAVTVFLAVTLIFVSVIGNGFFLAIFARFKVFRSNFTNILFANLAVVDCLTAIISIPQFVVLFVLRPNWLKGKPWTIITISLHIEFTLLSLVSMMALMVDRFFAVHLSLKYFTWKTTKKAKITVFLMWLVRTIVVVLAAIAVSNMDIDGMSLRSSTSMIFEERKLVIATFMVLFTIASTVLGILTSYSIHQKKKERKLFNLPPLREEARLKMDIKATKTVAMAVAVYFICYIPTVAYSIWRHNEEKKDSMWFRFMSALSLFLSSALNPIIYVLRSRRNRSALRQLLKDPCGTSAYQENPVNKESKAKLGEKKLQTEGEKIRECTDAGRSVRYSTNPVNDKRQPTTSKRQIEQPHDLAIKIAWVEHEEGSIRQDDQVSDARQARRDGEIVQDESVKSSGLIRERSKSMNAAGRKGTKGTSPGVKVRPRSSSLP